ncbi:hypothetical protein ACIA8K_20745 [Catenuloplanes sp. NPDC051500]|uniref:hypothetical protein n=1 Tax=Catenuloplanes sp. NPDC051500 TaxID=3363959 RepID=UPI0037B59F4F
MLLLLRRRAGLLLAAAILTTDAAANGYSIYVLGVSSPAAIAAQAIISALALATIVTLPHTLPRSKTLRGYDVSPPR